MQFQEVRTAFVVAVVTIVAGCATSPGAPGPVAHIDAPSMPTSLSRLEIAQNFEISPARPFSVAADADPSFALAHEGDGLQPGAQRARRHSGAQKNFTLLAADLPEGWTYHADRAVHHATSGLYCPISVTISDEGRRFTLRELQSFDAKGLDIGCQYSTDDGAFLTLFASFWPEMSLEDNMTGIVDAIEMEFQTEGQLPIAIATLRSESDGALFKDLETPVAASFDIGKADGVSYKTAVWLVKTYGWHVKARATYPREDMTSEIISSIMFAFSHLQVRKKNMSDPITQGGEV